MALIFLSIFFFEQVYFSLFKLLLTGGQEGEAQRLSGQVHLCSL